MAFTKIAAAGIGSTETVTLHSLEVLNNATVGGVLTYEDVTNVDSVGLITARNGIVVGSGITLSKDGDIFATGITTVSGDVKVGTGITLSPDGNIFTTGISTFGGNIQMGADNPEFEMNAGGPRFRVPSSNTLSIFTTGGLGSTSNERLRITSDGKILVNHTSARGIGGSQFRQVQIEGTGGESAISIVRNSNNGSGAGINLGKSRGSSTGGTTIVQDGDKLGVISFAGADGTDLQTNAAQISGEIDGTPGANDMPGRIVFKTTADGAATPTERLRIESTGTVKVSKNLSVTGIATVGSAVTISESGIEASGIGITFANINGGKIGGRRNIIINGAMVINQRNAATTSNNGYGCDRWRLHFGNTDESPTLSQESIVAGTEPYKIGLRKCIRLTNGNQTSGAGEFDYMWIRYRAEAQDIVTSGWNYTSSTSFLTLSFYIKSSVAQNFYGYVKDVDGSPDRALPFETGSLTANTWKRVSVLIPGDSGLTFDSNSGRGFEIFWGAFVGTWYSSNSSSVGTWKNYTDNNRVPDSTTTWYTTNDATLEITGAQLELGTEATPFEHRTFAEDYRDCLRYYYESRQDGNNFGGDGPNSYASGFLGFGLNGDRISASVRFPVPMRGIPSVTMIRPSDGSGGDAHIFRGVTGSNGATDVDFGTVSAVDIGYHGFLYWNCASNVTQGATYLFHIIADAEI